MRTSWPRLAPLAFAARAALAALVVAVGLLPRLAWASGSGAEAWAAGCPAERGLSARVVYRADELLLFDLEPGGLKVEVRPDSPRGFRHAGRFGVSPVGEFADWNQEPVARREALQSFVACLLADPSLAFTGETVGSSERSMQRSAATAPWLLLGGLAALAVALGRARHLRGKLLWLAGLFGAALAFRAVALPWAYFHQNGQGPLWIDYALGEPSPYGPGYREVFSWVARWALDRGHAPDHAVFVAQAALGALVVPAGGLLAHRTGARPALCLAVAFLLAIDPSLARAAQSESYYATLASLLFLATAALSVGVTRQRIVTADFGLGVLGAGLFIAQAARLHPIGWVAAATVPLACLALPGRVSVRLARTALAALGIGAVTALGAGRMLLAVTGGQLGGQWLPQALEKLSSLVAPERSRLGVVLVIVLVLSPRMRLPLLVLVACVAAGDAANLLGGSPALILGGYWHLYAPVLAVATVALLVELSRARRAATALAVVVASGGAALAVVSWSELTREPTDVREQAWAMVWRKTLPADARVAYVERADNRVVRLPLFGEAVRALHLEPGASVAAPTRAGQLYYVRTSLCASAEGRDACRHFEEQHRLRPVATRTLPSIASLPYLPLPEPTIDVALYEVSPR